MKRLTWDEYCAIEGVNISRLKEIRKSPRAYKHSLVTPKKDSPQMQLGRFVHSCVFEPDTVEERYIVFPGKVRRGKEWEAFKFIHKDREILKQNEWIHGEAIARAILTHNEVQFYLEGCDHEVSIQWTDKRTGIPCKARLDAFGGPTRRILDLKTTRDVRPRYFASDAARLSMHMQAAWYQRGLAQAELKGELVPYCIIAVEQEEPHDVVIYNVPQETLDVGNAECDALLDTLKECLETNKWPGVSRDEVDLVLPEWAVPESDQELIIEGERVPL